MTRPLPLRLARNPMGLFAITVLLLVTVASLSAPWIASHDPGRVAIDEVMLAPSPDHWLGTDGNGRDVYSRLLYAGRFSLAGALVALAAAFAIGVSAGITAGYYRGWFDLASSWLINLVMALPGIVVLLAARSVIGPSMWAAMGILGVLAAPSFFRPVYAAVNSVRGELYVDAARVSGLSDLRILTGHILPVVRTPVIIQCAMVGGIALAIQAGLDFLGLGDTTIPTWGMMLADGFRNMFTEPRLMLWPSLAIGLVCLAFALLANALRDALERSASPVGQAAAPEPAEDTTADPDRQSRIVHDGDAAGRPATRAHLLVVSNLSVGYSHGSGMTPVAECLDLTVSRGEVHGLIGESGSGKTQTAFAILGLLGPGGRILSGSVRFDGRELVGLPERELVRLRGKGIGYVPQEPIVNLDPSYSIGSQLAEPMRRTLGLSRSAARKRVLALLDRVGLADPVRIARAYPHQISGGMAQRVLIAGAISCDPDLLIADEPTTALDVSIQAEVLGLLRDIQKERQMGLLLVTHDFGVVADICDRVSVMRRGRIVECGPVRAIFHSARHDYTRMLLDSMLEGLPPRPSPKLHGVKGAAP